jgi:hypothetical protein
MNPFAPTFLSPARPAFLRIALALISAMAAHAAAESPPPAAAPKVATPIVSSDAVVQKNLAELDRVLDTSNAKFEETLRQNIERLEDTDFRQGHPEIDVVLREQPGIVPALKVERHFLIHRYVVRHARGPLLRPDIVALDEFLGLHPDIRKELDQEPSQLMASKFLVAHPSLGEFLVQHPALSTVLLDHKAAAPSPNKP